MTKQGKGKKRKHRHRYVYCYSCQGRSKNPKQLNCEDRDMCRCGKRKP